MSTHRIAAHAAAFVAGVALAAAGYAFAGDPIWNDGTPPERFRANAHAVVVTSSPAGVAEYCAKLAGSRPPPGMVIKACTFDHEGVTIVLMPNPCGYPDSDEYAHYLCHEFGHVNGWPGTHGP